MSVQRGKSIRGASRRPAGRMMRRRRVTPLGETKTVRTLPLHQEWTAAIPDDQWAIHKRAIAALRSAGIPFMLGGGFAQAAFTGRWRDTKDIDFYARPQDREASIKALEGAGFADYYGQLPYDRKWIHRSIQSNVIVDVIWGMANQRAQVDEMWLQRAGRFSLHDETLAVVPPEEFMWCKLYIVQRDRCDWTDLFNLLYATGEHLDWEHLLWRLQEDQPLLKALLTVYSWLCPAEAMKLRPDLWRRLRIRIPDRLRRPPGYDRIRLLDSRDWFAALRQPGEKLEV